MLVIATSIAGCRITATFNCEDSAQCGATGICEPNHLCAFPDPACVSGASYGDYSGALSGECVGGEDRADAARVDGAAGIDGPAGCATWSPQHVDACQLPAPSDDWHLTGGNYTYDTTTGTLTPGPSPASATIPQRDASAPPVRAVSVTSFAIDSGATLVVTGSQPLVIASFTTIELDGTIDAGSHRAASVGPGAATAGPCTAPGVAETALPSGGSGGGGGGGLRGNGGNGGPGDTPPGVQGGVGGGLLATPTFIRAGCAGADSGQAGPGAQTPATATTVSPGGPGGGAIELVAHDMILTANSAVITSGGAGGTGSPDNSSCGGGGGGSGGYIGLDAPVVAFGGGLFAANGGGGGASAAYTAGVGTNGEDGRASTSRAAGGAGESCAPPGGRGAAGPTLDGENVTGQISCGGGGGGGAVGFVIVWTANQAGSATFSPALISNP